MQVRLPHTPAAPLAHKTQEILRAVRSAFVQNGFDGASMQDLARAAGMSVGNFYRYFPSKDAIIAQMIALDMAEIDAVFAKVITSPQPMQALRAVIAQRVALNQCEKSGQLWAEITAAAQRKPEIAACACEMEASVAGYLIQVFAADTGLSIEQARKSFFAEAGMVILLIRSAAMQTPHLNQPNLDNLPQTSPIPDLTPIILRTINQVLDTVASAGSKG